MPAGRASARIAATAFLIQATCPPRLRSTVTPTLIPLGRADYLATWQAMRAFTLARDADTADQLWIVEHPPVFTLGQAGRREHLLAPGNIAVIDTDRGGQVTYHGPGQVVIYVLLDLRRLGIYVKELVFRIETALIQTLAAVGVDGRRVPRAPGIYVPWAGAGAAANAAAGAAQPAALPAGPPAGTLAGLAKIAALGLKVTHGCSYHGLALNVAMDLEPFDRINPCGHAGLPTVDLATLGVSISWHDAAQLLSARLVQHLSR